MLKKKIGIIGGMGAHATAYMFQEFINQTPAIKDQDFLEIFVHNNSKIPDRTDTIMNGETDKLFDEILRSAKIFDELMVDFILIDCITAHSFLTLLNKELSHSQIISLITEVGNYINVKFPHVKKIGILASSGAIKLNLWQKEFLKNNRESLVLNDSLQEKSFNSAIYGENGIKAGNYNSEVTEKLLQGVKYLESLGAEIIIGGCSELPLALSQNDIDIPFVDSIDIAVKRVLKKCYVKSPLFVDNKL